VVFQFIIGMMCLHRVANCNFNCNSKAELPAAVAAVATRGQVQSAAHLRAGGQAGLSEQQSTMGVWRWRVVGWWLRGEAKVIAACGVVG